MKQYLVFEFKFMSHQNIFYQIMGEGLPTNISLTKVKQWICVHTTAAESLFTNFVRMLDKVLEGQNISFQSALAWFTNAKHSLANVHRFSPFQLAIGQNTVLSSMSHDNQKYFTGDSVYFKRVNDWKWRGPRKVLGQDFQ